MFVSDYYAWRPGYRRDAMPPNLPHHQIPLRMADSRPGRIDPGRVDIQHTQDIDELTIAKTVTFGPEKEVQILPALMDESLDDKTHDRTKEKDRIVEGTKAVVVKLADTASA